jgi:hypothetical protein
MDKLFSLFLKEKEYLQNCTPNTIKFLKCSYNALGEAGRLKLLSLVSSSLLSIFGSADCPPSPAMTTSPE